MSDIPTIPPAIEKHISEQYAEFMRDIQVRHVLASCSPALRGAVNACLEMAYFYGALLGYRLPREP
jgi:hypothetical protein